MDVEGRTAITTTMPMFPSPDATNSLGLPAPICLYDSKPAIVCGDAQNIALLLDSEVTFITSPGIRGDLLPVSCKAGLIGTRLKQRAERQNQKTNETNNLSQYLIP